MGKKVVRNFLHKYNFFRIFTYVKKIQGEQKQSERIFSSFRDNSEKYGFLRTKKYSIGPSIHTSIHQYKTFIPLGKSENQLYKKDRLKGTLLRKSLGIAEGKTFVPYGDTKNEDEGDPV